MFNVIIPLPSIMMGVPSKSKLEILLLLLLFSEIAYSVRLPSISFVNQEEEATLGDSLELQCLVHFGSDFSVVWMKQNPTDPPTSVTISAGGSIVIPDTRFSISVDGDQQEQMYTLTIDNIKETDEGLYVCQVVVSTQTSVYAEVNVLVLRPPTVSDESTRSIVVSAGDDFELECLATGYPEPTVTWRRERNEYFPGTNTSVVLHGQTVSVKNATKDDRGTYYCVAWNGVGKGVRRRISVSVQFKPDVWAPRWRVGQALQYDQVMECRVEAFPSPAMFWEFHGRELTSNQDYEIANYAITDEITSTSLRILSAEKRQFGMYTCRAGNKFGFGEANVEFAETVVPVCPPACDWSSLPTSGAASIFPAISYVSSSAATATVVLLGYSIGYGYR